MTVRSSICTLVIFFASTFSVASQSGNKRTILTSGEKVFTIRYQLGQSTVLFFGAKPETVICGNNNYFAIEKFKEGITIQPLGNFSTNLTVLSQGKRFLFHLTPSRDLPTDTFVEVKWVPKQEVRDIVSRSAQAKESVRVLNHKLRVSNLDLKLLREIRVNATERIILEFEIKNMGRNTISSSDVEIQVVKGARALSHQITVFEIDKIKSGESTKGRLILTNANLKGTVLVLYHRGRSAKIRLFGERY